jgi:DNA-directed DNA polymerase III PolC
MSYAALHNHSFYSMLDSTMPPEQIVEAAVASGMRAVGLADRDTLAGAVAFYKKARAAGIHPVIGSEVTLNGGATLVLLVENARGYRNLCRLLTARIDHPDGLTHNDLKQFPEGLICLAGPRSEIAAAIKRNEDPAAALKFLRDTYGTNLALEMTPHNDEDLHLARIFATLSRRHRVALVTTCDTHYLAPDDRLRYDILASMRTLTLLNQRHAEKLPPGRYHWHTEEDMARFFGSLPQAMENTLRVAERCRFDFELGDIRFPKFPCENPAALLRSKVEAGIIRRYGAEPEPRVHERVERELGVIEEVGYAEYFLVFADLVEWCASKNIWTLARGSAAGSLVCYALGISNVCPFRFGLTFERFLNRERMQFAKLADIDLDLPWDRRDEVIRHVFEQYGKEHVAMIGAVHTFQGRSAVADIAKVYGIPEREARRFTEHIPWMTGDAAEAVRQTPECSHLPYKDEPYKTVLAMAGEFDGIPRHFAMHPCGVVISGEPIADRMPLFESAKGLYTTHYTMDDVEELGLLKMDLLGQAGLSVLRDTLQNLEESRGLRVDLDRIDWKDETTWESIATGNARGVFHIESPAMTSLLVMTDCRDIDCLTAVESIIRPGAANEGRKRAFARRHQGLEPVTYPHPSLENLLADTYGLMAYEEHILLVANGFAGMPWGRADQLRRALVKNKNRELIEELGREFRQCAKQLKRTDEEIAQVWGVLHEFAGYMFNKAHSAAYAVEAFTGAWLKARYPAEFLAAVMTSRRGFYSPMLYVMEALRQGARFHLPDLHASDPRRFLVSEPRPSGSGGIPECASQLATQEQEGTAAWWGRLQSARGIQPRPLVGAEGPAEAGPQTEVCPTAGRPLSSHSRSRLRPETPLERNETILLPLDQIRALTQGTLDRIVEQRPFHDLGDFFRKTRPSRAEWLALLKAGALDVFNEPRGRLFWRLQRLDAVKGESAERHLLREPGNTLPTPESTPRNGLLIEPELPETFDPSPAMQARWEYEVLGFPVSVHPLEYFAPNLDWRRYRSAADLARNQKSLYGKQVRVAGLVVADRHHPTADGTMKFLTLADWTGFVEVSLFARVYREYGHKTVHPVLGIEATVDPFDNRKGFALNGQKVL